MKRCHHILSGAVPVALALIGFSRPADAQTFLVTEIAPLAGHTTSVAMGVNKNGVVVGYSYLSGADPNAYAAVRAFRWLEGSTQPIGLLSGKDGNVATAINNLDEAVGYAFNISGSSFVNMRGFIDLPVPHYGLSSLATDLGHLGGGESSAYAINDFGNVVGESTTVDGYSHAFLWLTGPYGPYASGGMWDLLSLSGQFGTSTANAINNSNLITGGTTTATGPYQAFVWSASSATPYSPGLNNLGALNSLADSLGSGLNDAGVVAGFSYTSAADTTFKATIFDHGKLTAYSPLVGGTYGGAHNINSFGQIVGYSDHTASATEGTRAVIISNGTQYDLNTLIAGGTGWKMQDALAISETGKVVGYGSLLKPDSTTPTRAFVLTPNFKLLANTGVPATISAGTSVTTAAVNIDKVIGMAIVVKLSSNNAKLHVPDTVVIPAGSLTKTFTLSADAGSSGQATITASLYGVDQPSTLTIQTSNLKATTLTLPNVTGSPNATVSLKATLKAGTANVSGKTITFKVDGNTIGTAVTSSSGIATLSHQLTESGGDHPMSAEFAGDAVYSPSSASATLSVKVPTSTITVTSVSGNAGATVTLKSTLKGGTPPVALSGKTVTFRVDGVAVTTAVTDNTGLASNPHVLTESGGAHTLTAEFAGDSSYASSSATGTLTVKLFASSLAVTSVTTTPGATVQLTATLKSGATPLSGKTISFKVAGTPVGSAITNPSGVATLPHAANEGGGTYELRAEFVGDTYAPATATGTLTIKKLDTKTSPSAASGKVGATVTLKATVKAGTTPVVGATVTFKVDNVEVGTPTTDLTGLASMRFVVPEGVGATHTIEADYGGDSNHSASSGTAALTIQQAATKITADAAKPAALSTFAYGAKLVRTTDNAVLSGKTLNFYDGTTLLGTGVTDATGRATINLTAPVKGLKKTITVKFIADANYAASSGTGSVTGG